MDLDSNETLVVLTSSDFNILNHPNKVSCIINILRINDIRYINKFFESVNLRLKNNDVFIGCLETFSARRNRKPIGKVPLIRTIYFGMEYIFMRVFPKLWGFKKVYFFVTRGRNRLLSKAEALGRLVSCGFEIVDYKSLNGLLYFVVKKVKEPEFNMNPSYGPFYKMPRVGKNGKTIGVYKVRTMYSYAEYLQKYIYDKHGSTDGDKANEDYRVTSFGKIIRKFWLDELPMLINLFKGEIKLVGARPLSLPKFNMYPKNVQERRCQFKPGLIPPFYYDCPKNFEELIASEMRYFDAYEKKPFKTDIKYFFVAMFNIIFKGARSK